MYHDEFARNPVRIEPPPQSPLPGLALEVGGGLWLGLLASLNPPILTALFFLGGLLPLIASCITIGLYRSFEALDRLANSARSGSWLPGSVGCQARSSASLLGLYHPHIEAKPTRVSSDHASRRAPRHR